MRRAALAALLLALTIPASAAALPSTVTLRDRAGTGAWTSSELEAVGGRIQVCLEECHEAGPPLAVPGEVESWPRGTPWRIRLHLYWLPDDAPPAGLPYALRTTPTLLRGKHRRSVTVLRPRPRFRAFGLGFDVLALRAASRYGAGRNVVRVRITQP